MTESNHSETTNIKTPWHLWTVGIIGFLWSAIGAMDFVMTQTQNEAYMSAFTPEQLEFFYGIPMWAIITWGIAVWGGTIGSIFLLIRKKIATPIFLASLIGMVITSIQNYVLSNGMEIMGDAFSLIFTGIIFTTSVGLYWYSRTIQQNGLLK